VTKGTFDGETSSAVIFQFLLEAAVDAGLERNELLSLAGVRAEGLEGPGARVPRVAHHKLWDEFARRTGDECVGLRVAERARRPGAFGVLDYLVRSSADLGQALDQLARFLPLLFVGDEVVDERGEHDVLFGYRRGAYRFTPSRHAGECNVAAFLYVSRQLLGTEWAPLEVFFEHGAPLDVREHRRAFRAPLHFGASLNGLRFERALLDRPALPPDPGLSAVLGHLAERLLLEIAHEPLFSGQVRRFLLEACRAGADPSLEAAAWPPKAARTANSSNARPPALSPRFAWSARRWFLEIAPQLPGGRSRGHAFSSLRRARGGHLGARSPTLARARAPRPTGRAASAQVAATSAPKRKKGMASSPSVGQSRCGL
jgi:hypothetical protein